MQTEALTLIALGLLFLAGLAADQIGKRTRLPRVTLLLGCGVLAGRSGFDLIPAELTAFYPTFSVIALTAVAFLLGSSLSWDTLRRHGSAILIISIAVVLLTLLTVSAGLWAVGVPLAAALALGALSTATDPAATFDVIAQSGQDNGFTRTLKGIVAIDDAWGLVVFSLVLVAAQSLAGSGTEGALVWHALREVFGSILLGLVIGVPSAYLTGRICDGEPLRAEALGLIFLTAGLAIWLELSFLIAGMTVGAVIVNLARHHRNAFHEIENFQWPFLIIFFILAGASLDLAELWALGLVGLAYAAFRVLGRVLGGWLGGRMIRAPKREGLWYGPALLPQAGVAIGMALVAADTLPAHGDLIMAITIGTTVGFELIGPLVTAVALKRLAG
ncbi:MAG: cation:proton antiporter [Rhodobacteraceae bacterium]|nr:cation:proton antiporter [Paracoccaceae bacterium]